jgi:hypothetical protein
LKTVVTWFTGLGDAQPAASPYGDLGSIFGAQHVSIGFIGLNLYSLPSHFAVIIGFLLASACESWVYWFESL